VVQKWEVPSFADDDPKTAEVISKALLLAQDHQIKDPTVLAQLLQFASDLVCCLSILFSSKY